MMHFSPEELNKDELKWKNILSDVETTHDGSIYFSEFQNAIENFVSAEFKSSFDLIIKSPAEVSR